MSMSIPLAICCFVSVSAILAISKWLRRSQRSSLPPGPRGLPFFGTPSELTRDYLWLHDAKYKNLYGPISAVTDFGHTIILLNDVEVARELLEKQASVYSERPPMVFGPMYVQHTAYITDIQSTRPRISYENVNVVTCCPSPLSQTSIRRSWVTPSLHFLHWLLVSLQLFYLPRWPKYALYVLFPFKIYIMNTVIMPSRVTMLI